VNTLVAWMLALQLFASAPATAQVVTAADDPFNYPLKQYGLMLGVAIFGGLVSWIAKVRRGEVKPWQVNHLIGELCTSAFAGLLAFWVCKAFNTPASLTPALVGIAGHMGTKAIAVWEAWATKRWGAPEDTKDKP
jgi:hypothetical protein